MASLDYCKFQVAEQSLRQCLESFHSPKHLSEEEQEARRKIIEMSVSLALGYGDEIDRVVIEEEDE